MLKTWKPKTMGANLKIISNAYYLLTVVCLQVLTNGLTPAIAQPAINEIRPVFDESFDHWPVITKSNGRVIINRGVTDFGQAKRLLRQLASKQKVAVFATDEDSLAIELLKVADQKQSPATPSNVSTLEKALADCDTVYVSGQIFSIAQVTQLRKPLTAFVNKGGNLIFDAKLGHLLGTSESPIDQPKRLNLFPDCLIDCDFDGNAESSQSLIDRVANNPRSVGIGIEANTCVVLAGRQLFSIASGSCTLALPKSQNGPAVIQKVGVDRTDGQTRLVDLTQWRRRAIDRTLAPFPSDQPRVPFVENGTLFIVGGGGTPRGLMTEMINLAGGIEKAKPVYVPCSESIDVGQRQGTVEMWKRMGVKNATFIHTKDREKANADESFLQPLGQATMLWFGGGRQWNFADSYYGTKAHKLMKEVLHRGGVVGGSSAGASIQGRFLARATPIGNSNILAPGYERGGLGFLSGVAIDQHFSQRRRQKDMTKLIAKYPQLLGIGIDESTAIKVQKSTATVIGRGKVYFYDAAKPREDGQADYEALAAGGVYDLAQRKIIKESK
jgi:cyanophycinase